MRCRKARKKIYGYIDGYLDAFEIKKLEDHLSICDDCAKELEAESRVIQLVVSLPNIYPSDEAWSNFIPELHRRIELELVKSSIKSRGILSFENLKFAAVLGALTLAIFSASFSGLKVISSSRPQSQMQIRSHSNMRQTELVMAMSGYDIMADEPGAAIESTLFKPTPKYETEQRVPISISEAIDQSSLIFDNR